MERESQQPEGDRQQQPEQDASPERWRAPQPRIYVVSVADYDQGVLHDAWINAHQAPEELWLEIQHLLHHGPSRGDEWAILDQEDFFGLQLDEHEDLSTVSRVAAGVVRYGEALALLGKFAGLDDLSFLETAMRTSYLGAWESLDALAEHVIDDMGIDAYIETAPESYRRYLRIDVDELVRDLRMRMTVLE